MADVLGAYQRIGFAETYVDGVTLETRTRDSFPLTPSFGVVWYRSVDMGFPDVRASVQDLPDASGTFDETQFQGARAISITGVVINDAYGDVPGDNDWDPSINWNSASWWCTALSAWGSPARRWRLYFKDDSGRSRYLDVRGDSFTAPVDSTGKDYREFQLNLVNPSGRIYSFNESPGASSDGRNRVTISQSDTTTVQGRAYPEIGPYTRDYPAAVTGANAVLYAGSVSNGFTCNIYTGSSTMIAPRIAVTAPDRSVRSIGLGASLTIAAHTTLSIDTINRTIQTRADNASTFTNVEQYVDAPVQWPVLKPGVDWENPISEQRLPGYNSVGFTASSAAADSTITILWNDADLL